MSDSFTATAAALSEQVRRARGRRDEKRAHRALQELLTLYVQLGNREVGTLQEQNDYIVARHLGQLPEALQDLGVRPDDLPEPPGRRRPAPPAVDPERIASHLAHVGAPDDEPHDRFVVQYRPEDDKRFKGRLCPWAVIDTSDGLPVAWYYDKDFAELTADAVSQLRRPED
ncbi:hypothetical protein [Streptomyces sp. NPDC085937]|uniref:hypothetical protein n=1 Tax=Streptomyces sp. NPDC085937 TaxID=3365742 RepID=UPI0037D85105